MKSSDLTFWVMSVLGEFFVAQKITTVGEHYLLRQTVTIFVYTVNYVVVYL